MAWWLFGIKITLTIPAIRIDISTKEIFLKTINVIRLNIITITAAITPYEIGDPKIDFNISIAIFSPIVQ